MERLHAARPLRLSGLVLIPIQRVRLEHCEKRGGYWVHGLAEPYAVVFAERGGWRAIDMAGKKIPLKPLLREAAGLAESIRRVRAC